MSIRVLVADDQDLVRTGLRMILDAQPGIEVVGEAVNGREAVALARALRPDVCLFDIRMPELHLLTDWREALGSLHARLAPGGALVTSTVCLGDGFGFLCPAAPLGRRLGLLPTLSFFTRATLEREIDAVVVRG